MSRYLVLIWFIFIVLYIPSSAQNALYISLDIKIDRLEIEPLEWVPDSSYFIVKGYYLQTGRNSEWFTVHAETLEITRSDIFPVYQDLTPSEHLQLNASPIVYTSPDSQLVLYSRPQTYNEMYPQEIVIANRLTGEVFQTDINTFEMTEDTRHISTILWNANSDAVVVELIGDNSTADIYFIKIPDQANLQASIISRFITILIGEDEYTTPDTLRNGVSAIHPTEDHVLLYANKDEIGVSSSQEDLFLIDWYPLDESQSRVLHQEFNTDTTFTPRFILSRPSEIVYSKLLLVESYIRGIYLLNLDTNHETLLFEMPSGLFTYSFSPDGRWAPLVDQNDNLYLLDMLSLYDGIPFTNAGKD